MGLWAGLSEPWRACLDEAWAAYAAGSIPVGAVVADPAGRILARGRNRSYEWDGRRTTTQSSPLSHAEMNALSALDYAEFDPHPCIMYASSEPCPLCFGALYMSGVRELRFAARDPYAGSANLLGTTAYLSRKPIRVVPPQDARLETAVIGMCTEFALRAGFRAGGASVVDVWRVVLPEGVHLGEALFQSGWLRRMRDAGAPASEVFDGLALRAGAR